MSVCVSVCLAPTDYTKTQQTIQSPRKTIQRHKIRQNPNILDDNPNILDKDPEYSTGVATNIDLTSNIKYSS